MKPRAWTWLAVGFFVVVTDGAKRKGFKTVARLLIVDCLLVRLFKSILRTRSSESPWSEGKKGKCEEDPELRPRANFDEARATNGSAIDGTRKNGFSRVLARLTKCRHSPAG